MGIYRPGFQSTHPCGVRIALPFSRITKQCFNPRTRVGCENPNPPVLKGDMVSIHAPVWGANPQAQVQLAIDTVSIHAPVWGAKCLWYAYRAGEQVSIHAPVWGAKILSGGRVRVYSVSIHAPVWGANPKALLILPKCCFNPRTRVGCESFFGW